MITLMIRTQVSFDKGLYGKARKAAKRRGVSLAELCRRGLEQILSQESPKSKERPWMAYAGMLEGREADSSSVDTIVYDRESP